MRLAHELAWGRPRYLDFRVGNQSRSWFAYQDCRLELGVKELRRMISWGEHGEIINVCDI